MNSIILYFLKTGIALTIFYIAYRLLLSYGTHFRLNRFILLASLILSFVIPFLSFDFLVKAEPAIPVFTIVFDNHSPMKEVTSDTNYSSGWDVWKIVRMLYLIGCGLVMARLIYQVIYIRAVQETSRKNSVGGTKIIEVSSDIIPFSIFNQIYIPANKYSENELKSIVEHELAHLKQFHFIDLLIIEIIIVLQWFNPIAWMYARSLKEVHEFLADEAVLKQGINQGKYQALLVNEALGGPVFAISNQFNQSLIKKRIIMMTKMKTSGKSKLRALFFVPLTLLLLVAFANPQKQNPSILKSNSSLGAFSQSEEITVNGKVVDEESGKPISGAFITVKGSTTGTATDNSGNYMLKLQDSNVVLVFSCVSYTTILEEVGSKRQINVALKKDFYTIDFSKGNKLIAVNRDVDDSKKTTKSEGKDVFVVVEEMPSYPGGTDALREYIRAAQRYPEGAMKAGIEGTVMVNFLIDPQGKVQDARVIRAVNSSLDAEALRIVNSITKWNPGKQGGKSISYRINLPVEFKIK